MSERIDRREFLRATTATTAALALAPAVSLGEDQAGTRPVRVGLVGAGNRGCALLRVLVGMEQVTVPAVCDIDKARIAVAAKIIADAGEDAPEGYADGDGAYRRLMGRDDLDAVIIATPWELHTPMAVAGMRAGKYVGTEVPAAINMEQCWELVRVHEETRVPCMMLENWSFRRDNLAVLNMIRKGLFGEMVHCHCAHSHDCIDHWFFDREGNDRWAAKYLIERNCDQYPTHSLGPVISWLDINCGDYFKHLTATATSSRGINAYFARKFGPDHPSAKRKYAQGDIVTSVIQTHKGRTIVINYDMQLPRPYDNRWTVQGILGLYNEQRNAVYVTDRSPEYHQWESFDPYQREFEHAWWRQMSGPTGEAGHGGTDHLELQEFVRAVRNRTQTPIDVYDSVIMSVITPLSQASIAGGSVPVECPDFTKGAWKSRKPSFALDVR